MSGTKFRLRRAPQNPAMAGGVDDPNLVYEVWVCGAPRGDYPGAFPNGFLSKCRPWMNGCGLVAFAGKERITGAVHVDLDPECEPDILGDVADLPRLVGDERFDWIIADPPYGDEYARAMYRNTRLVREGTSGKPYKDDKGSTYWPHRWLAAMANALRPGGHLLYLDQLCPYGPRGTNVVRRAFVFRGTNMRATCCTIIRKSGTVNGTLARFEGATA